MALIIGWSDITSLDQTITCTAKLSTTKMYYLFKSGLKEVECSKDSVSPCRPSPPIFGNMRRCSLYAGCWGCGGCGGLGVICGGGCNGDPSLNKSLCMDGALGGCSVSVRCQENNDPPTAPPCPVGMVRLLDEFWATGLGWINFNIQYCKCETCHGQCERNSYCRGGVYLEKSMDLGSAKSWTVKNRKPNETSDLALNTSYVVSRTTLFSASATARWDYDMEVFVDVAVYTKLVLWLSDLRTKTTLSASVSLIGTDVVAANRVRDLAFCVGVSAWWSDGLYEPAGLVNPTNSFHTLVDVLDVAQIERVRDTVFQQAYAIIQAQYDDKVASLTYLDVLTGLALPPMPSVETTAAGTEQPYLTLYLSLKQAKRLLQSEQLATEEATLMVSTFLCEDETRVQRPGTGSSPLLAPKLFFPGGVAQASAPAAKWLQAQAVVVQTKTTSGAWQTGPYTKGGLYNVDASGKVQLPVMMVGSPSLVIVHYVAKLRVDSWSVMLAAYFQSVLGVTTPPFGTPCDQLDIELVTRACYQSASSADQALLATGSCEVRYTPPFASSGAMPELMLYAGSVDTSYDGGRLCACYNTNMAPALQRDNPESRTASRCYSVKCSEDQRLEMRLTTEECSATSVCDRMWGWLNSKDPAQQGVDLSSFDWVRYKLLCGRSIQPLGEEQYDWRMFAATGVACVSAAVILCALPTVRDNRWVRVSTARYVFVCGSLVVLGILVAAMFGWVLCGKAVCSDTGAWPRASLCVSRVLGTPLLAQSCSYVAQCECQLDGDCGPSGCVCPSGFCVDAVGVRETVHKRFETIETATLVPLLALAVLAPCLIVLWSPPPHRKSNIVIICAVLSCCVLVAIAGGVSYHRDDSVLSFGAKPACGNLGDRIVLTVVDRVTGYIVQFPTTSTWTQTGFPSSSSQGWQAPAYLGFVPRERELAYTSIQEALGETWMIDGDVNVIREMQMIVNDVDTPNPRSFYVLQVSGSNNKSFRGTCVVASREQSTLDPRIDIWVVAWGYALVAGVQSAASEKDAAYDLGQISTLPCVLGVIAQDGTNSRCDLYSYTTAPTRLHSRAGSISEDGLMATGPTCVTASTEPELFLAAQAAMTEGTVLRQQAIMTASMKMAGAERTVTAALQAEGETKGAPTVVCVLQPNLDPTKKDWFCHSPGRPSFEMELLTTYACPIKPIPPTLITKKSCSSCGSHAQNKFNYK